MIYNLHTQLGAHVASYFALSSAHGPDGLPSLGGTTIELAAKHSKNASRVAQQALRSSRVGAGGGVDMIVLI